MLNFAVMSRDDPRLKLTDSQLACVRLVPIGSSKRIAQRLGISPHTVDTHLRAAMKRLGISARADVAALVLEWDRAPAASLPLAPAPPTQSLSTQPPELVPPAGSGISKPSYLPSNADGMRATLRDVGYFDPAYAPVSARPFRSEPEVKGRGALHILALCVAIAVGIAVLGSAAQPLGEGFEALARLVRSYRASLTS